AYYILQQLSGGGNHTVSSLSKALAPFRNLIYPAGDRNRPRTLKQMRIPKIDISRCLSTLGFQDLVQKRTRLMLLGRFPKTWTVRANVFNLTAKGYLALSAVISPT
ncbi:unnamed protein product, partial [marine sediment metagenome]